MNEYPITNTWLNMFYVEGPGPKSKHYTTPFFFRTKRIYLIDGYTTLDGNGCP